jgi:F-type H+-transporting ATPase subunit gamma
MATLLDFRRRIRSVKSTQQITRAMKFVAAAKLRRAQEGVFAARPYAKEILRVLRSAAARMEEAAHPLLERRSEDRILALVLTGDRALCGAFNSNVIRQTMEFFGVHKGKKIELIIVGRKGRETLRRRGYTFVGEYMDVSNHVEYSKAKEIAGQVANAYASGEVDSVYVIYNEFKSVMVQKLRAQKLLPIDPEVIQEAAGAEQALEVHAGAGGHLPVRGAGASGEMLVDYIYEQPVAEIFAGLVPRYLEAEIFRVLLESAAAEHAARMTAMDSATRNARELIEKLTLQMNKIRQAAITKEIIEIVSGAASATS